MKIVQNEEREGFDKKLYVGTAEVRVLAINPSNEELYKMLGREVPEEKAEIEYVKEDTDVKFTNSKGEEDSDTATRLFVDVWVQEVTSEEIMKIRFILTDFPQYNKDGSKQQYINQVGQTTWITVGDEDSLPDWFTHWNIKDRITKEITDTVAKEFRPAMRGEADFYEFLKSWSNLNVWSTESDVFVENNKKFWRGNLSEFKPLLATLEDNTVLVQCGVKTVLKTDEEGNETSTDYQSIYTRAFAPGNSMKDFNFHKRNNFAGLKDAKYAYDLKNFFKNVFDEEYGFKDFTVKGYFTEYSSEMNNLNTDSAMVADTSSVSY
jgi:hypothetical protein